MLLTQQLNKKKKPHLRILKAIIYLKSCLKFRYKKAQTLSTCITTLILLHFHTERSNCHPSHPRIQVVKCTSIYKYYIYVYIIYIHIFFFYISVFLPSLCEGISFSQNVGLWVVHTGTPTDNQSWSPCNSLKPNFGSKVGEAAVEKMFKSISWW